MHSKLIVFLLLVVGIVAGSSTFDWLKFKRDHNKHYASAQEEALRKRIFLSNLERVRNHERNHPSATFKIGINHLADRRIEELVSPPKHSFEMHSEGAWSSPQLISVPDSLDWRSKGVISPVQDQGSLGRADAIAAVETVETWYAIATGNLVRGSVARLADCCPQEINIFQCILKLGGICRADDYPFTTNQCVPKKCTPYTHFNKALRLKDPNEDTMVQWIQNSSLFVGIDASQPSFELYTSGIYQEPSCSKTVIDHTMQLVGYGKTASGDLYWICKNSWGAGWGEQGYIRVLRGQNMCGIASYVIQVS